MYFYGLVCLAQPSEFAKELEKEKGDLFLSGLHYLDVRGFSAEKIIKTTNTKMFNKCFFENKM